MDAFNPVIDLLVEQLAERTLDRAEACSAQGGGGASTAFAAAQQGAFQHGAALQLVTGVHGVGKGATLEARAAEMLAAGVPRASIMMLDLTDARLLAAGRDARLLERALERHGERNPQAAAGRRYLFFNRIDLLEGWQETLVRMFSKHDLRVVATGECASWLSDVPASCAGLPEPSQVTERLPVGLAPFAGALPPQEIRTDAPSAVLDAYLERGGLVLAPECDDPTQRTARFQALVRDAVLLAATFDRRLSQVPLACATAQLALASAGRRFSVTAAEQVLRARGFGTTRGMVAQQLEALCDLHLVYAVRDFDAALKGNPRSAAVLYAGDHALPAAFGACTPGCLDVAKNAVYLHLRRTDSFGGIYSYRVAPGPGGTVDFAVGNPASAVVHALFHLVDQPQGQPLKRALALLDKALARTGLRAATLVHLGERYAVCPVAHGSVRCVPLRDWLLGE